MNRTISNSILIFLLLFSAEVFCQPFDILKLDTMDAGKSYPRYTFIETKAHYGKLLPTNDILSKSIGQNPMYAFDIRFGWKGYGNKMWHSYYKYPSFGVGWFSCYFNPRENSVGNPNSLYVWYNQPIFSIGLFSFNAELDFGLSYNFFPYDSLQNPEQTVIGSSRNVFFSPGFEGAFSISKRLDLTMGINFIHFSNGRIKTPQKGMNLSSLSGKIRYNFKPYIRKNGMQRDLPVRPENIPHERIIFPMRWEFSMNLSGGIAAPKDYSNYKDIYFGIATLGLDVARHYSFCSKIVVGFDLFYDGSIVEEMHYHDSIEIAEVPAIDKFVYGVHFGHELMVQRWTLITQLGTNLNYKLYKGDWYARVGIRYDLTKHMFLRIALKTPDSFHADFIEWGGGVSLYKIKGVK